ncbi:putative secondary metabolism biosynthetic enzyme [Arachnomyces sp. PD_36]|nr:putative secondary metabolism biosynthetic enzyme [Arachnomyces sp. PD_36]
MAIYTGKTAVVIGGTQGIGLSTAQLLVDQGAKVVVTGRSPSSIESTEKQLGSAALVVKSDITSTTNEAFLDLESGISSHLGAGIDLLFVNAGYALLQPFLDVTEESFDTAFNTNVRGAFFTAKRLVPLVRPGGAIVFTTSVSNQSGFPGMAVYSATKAAVKSLVQTLAAELAGKQVRVNAVSPGFVKTPTMGVAGVSADEVAAFEKIGIDSTPMGRVALPEEVAKAVVFMGIEATFSTGTELLVDGGLSQLQKGDH